MIALVWMLACSTTAFTVPAASMVKQRGRRATVAQRPATALKALPGWLPSLPAAPAGSGAVAADLGTYFVKTLISWGVPAAVVVVAVLPLIGMVMDKGGGRTPGSDFGDEFALEDEDGPGGGGFPFGGPGGRRRPTPNRMRAPEYLKVERLNARLESYDFSLTAATSGRLAASRARRTARLRRAFGDEVAMADLDDDSLDALEAAEAEYLDVKGSAARDAAVARSRLRSGAGGEARNATVLGRMMRMGKDAASSDLDALGRATRAGAEAELAYLGAVAALLPTDGARERFAALSAATAPDAAAPIGGALAFARAGGGRPRAYVLDYAGDVQASQTAALREEVTAVLDFANGTRGDTVVLRLSSGGGTVTGYGLAAAQLSRIKGAGLHLTVCVEQVAASGGYMMACVGDRIVASPFAVLGSIGVIAEQPNVYERLKKEGVEFTTVTAGEYKRTLTPTKKITKEDFDKSKRDVKEIFDLFKAFVAAQRPSLDIDAVATGETWFGDDAVERKLCDELKTFDDVVLDLDRAGADVLKVTYAPPPASPLAALLQPAGAAPSSAPAALAALARAALPLVGDLARSDAAGGPLAVDDARDRFRA